MLDRCARGIPAVVILFTLSFVPAAPVAQASDHEAAVRAHLAAIRSWAADPVVIDAVRAQNAENAGLSQGEIDRADEQWRAETATAQRPMIDRMLANPLSQFLQIVKANSDGLYTEIFVMDNKGLNVGQSDVTSDYWQGDEAKWKNSYLAGPGAVFIDGVEHDESTQQFQTQVSLAISDPSTSQVIGAVTVGIDVERLLP